MGIQNLLLVVISSACAIAAASTVAIAQDLPRGKVFGVVEDSAGKPWVGAEVHLFSRTATRSETGEFDHIMVRTGSDGRFRAEILTGRAYSAWAFQETDGDRYRSTAILEPVMPNLAMVLTENTAGPFPLREVRFEPSSEFTDRKFTFVYGEENKITMPLGRRGKRWHLPPCPAEFGHVHVSDGTGSILSHRVAIETTASLAAKPPEERPVIVRFPASRHTYLLQVRRGFEGPPVAGATVYGRRGRKITPVTTTDARGFAEVELRLTSRQTRALGSIREVIVHKSGLRIGGLRATKDLTTEKSIAQKRAANRPDVVCDMGEGRDVQGRILLAPGTPAANLPFLIYVDGFTYFDKENAMGAVHRIEVRTDETGRFTFLGMGDSECRLECTLERPHILGLPASWRPGLSPRCFLGYVRGGKKPEQIILSESAPIDFRIKGSDGTPVDTSRVCLERMTGASSHVFTDRNGKLRAMIPMGMEMVIAVAGRTGVGFHHMLKERSGTELTECEIRLGKSLTIHGRVVDNAGRGIAGASVSVYTGNLQHVELPEPPVFSATPKPSPHVRLLPVKNRRIMQNMIYQLGLQTRTDDHGNFAIAAPPFDLDYSASATIENGGMRLRTREAVTHDEATAQPLELTLTGFERKSK